MKKYVVEFIGTFFLVLVVGLMAINPGSFGMMTPLVIGAVLMVMVYAGGYISGGHYNPAVTLGAWLRGAARNTTAMVYMGVQLIAGVCAALVAVLLRGTPPPTTVIMSTLPLLLVEFLFTFALVYVVLHTASARRTAGNSYFGLAIGFTLAVGIYSADRLSGGAFNPAVALGFTIMGLSPWADIWKYFLADLVGGAAAAFVFNFLHRGDDILAAVQGGKEQLQELLHR